MSFESYITFLIENFHKEKEDDQETYTRTSLSHQWFGLLPFLFKWLFSSDAKN